jgi:hypothetical protein
MLLLMTVCSLHNNLIGQCVIKNVIVKVNSSTPSASIPNSCDVNFDFIFTVENNGGNKYIYFHAWLKDAYPNYFGCPNPANNIKPPVAADLLLSKINIGIHNDIHTAHPAPFLVSTYFPDLTVPITPAISLIRSVFPTGDSARFIIKGVQINVPGSCNSIISMVADFWSSQSEMAQNAQCVSCNINYTIDPRVDGFVNCNLPHTFNVIISTVSPTVITGFYDVFLDSHDPLNSNALGTYGAEDNVKVYSSSFTTVVNGGTNSYTAFNVPYLPYSNQKPDSDKHLWVVVSATQYSNKAINILPNSCAPLSLNLIKFTVEQKSTSIMLQWSSEAEKDVKGFYIEKKSGNESFKEIGFITAKSLLYNESTSNYSFSDPEVALDRITYYRLKIADENGSYTYSEIRSIRTGKAGMKVSVYPNPNMGNFKITVPSNMGIYEIQITDYAGNVIKKMSNLSNENVYIGNLLPGVYIVKVYFKASGESAVEKIIIQ